MAVSGSSQCHPVRPTSTALSNTANDTVDIFSVASGAPVFQFSLPVGLDPASARFRTDGELWVANWISDSVSVVDAATHRVVATLHPGDAPGDVVFAAGKAFVALSGAHDQVVVYDRSTYAELARLEVFGEHPRALAASADGREVYLVVLNSGNRTTTVGAQRVAAGGGMPPPNPAKIGRASCRERV